MSEKWIKKQSKRVYDGYRKVDTVTYILPNGQEELFDIRIDRSSVAVLALTDKKEVVLATQYRPGPDAIIHELPGGVLENEEDYTEAIKRELLEETGYVGTLEHVITINVDAYSPQRRHYFVATNCARVNSQKLDPTEFIDVTLMELEAFKSYMKAGYLTDTACAYACLDYMDLL